MSTAVMGNRRLAEFPLADPACVDMHEVGPRIIADAATGHMERGVVQPLQRDAGKQYVRRLALDMQAVDGDAAGRPVKPGIGFGGAITADQLKRFAGPELRVQIMDQVEQARIDMMDLIIVMIAHEVVDMVQRVRKILAVLPIDQRSRFIGMDVEHVDGTFLRQRLGMKTMMRVSGPGGCRHCRGCACR